MTRFDIHVKSNDTNIRYKIFISLSSMPSASVSKKTEAKRKTLQKIYNLPT